MPTVRANGLDIACTIDGTVGEPLVLLHGASSSAAEDWAAVRPALRRHFRLHLVDARGHAGTRWVGPDGVSGWDRRRRREQHCGRHPARGLGIESLVADLGRVRRHARPRPVPPRRVSAWAA